MKKFVFFMLLFIGCINVCSAQNLEEVIYLKNGSVIRGVITEQIPGVSLKISTKDGNIFAYQMDDVEKITKEAAFKNNNSFSFEEGNKSGYKGFIDFGYTIGTGDFKEDRIELTTSHGIQINPYVYFGAGFGANYYLDSKVFALPIFLNSRFTFINKGIAPYLDIKAGYSFTDVEGLYISPSIGCKIGHFNVSCGYTIQKFDAEWLYYYYNGYNYDYSITKTTENCNGINIKIGYEF